MLSARRSATGDRRRPGRAELAFAAKAVLNLPTTRDLIDRLRVDETLRRRCGWLSAAALPHESVFPGICRFAGTDCRSTACRGIAATQQQRLIGHIARDSTAILARELFPNGEQRRQRERKRDARFKRGRRGLAWWFHPGQACDRGTRIERQRHQHWTAAEDCRGSAISAQRTARARSYWRGYKLHLDVADEQLPVSAMLTSASVHDSQVAIPL